MKKMVQMVRLNWLSASYPMLCFQNISRKCYDKWCNCVSYC
jgi:hypothetical protein